MNVKGYRYVFLKKALSRPNDYCSLFFFRTNNKNLDTLIVRYVQLYGKMAPMKGGWGACIDMLHLCIVGFLFIRN
jgi:hypothetical protein